MKVSLRGLQDYCGLLVPSGELFNRLTMGGTEVESVHVRGIESMRVVVAQIVSSVPHPNADRLRVCQINDGTEMRQIVCGAKNFKDNDKVPLALPGAELPGGFKIKESKLRGELSQGMLCSAKELNLAEDAEGLLILPPETPVGKPVHEVVPGDVVFEIEVTSNRPDLLSYTGLAREIAAVGAGRLKPLAASTVAWPAQGSDWSVELAAGERAPYYTATLLRNVKVGPSPEWLQEKIAATGHKPINNVVDITNFVLWELGQPLHAFDAAKLQGRTIRVRSAKAGETFAALDDKTYALADEDLVIADASGVVALAGVMGGKPTGVGAETTEVLLESAWFSPRPVRATSRRLGLTSDSSYRFERRVDPQAVLRARDRAVQLLVELAGAEIAAAPVVAGAVPESNAAIGLRWEQIKTVLGYEISAARVEEIFTALGLTQEGGAWLPPSFRPDLVTEIDLIEEIARIEGLERVEGKLPAGVAPSSPADARYERWKALRQALARQGWNECLGDALVDKTRAAQPDAVELRNPLNEHYTHLRPNVKGSLLAAAAMNLARGNGQIRLFEVGRVFRAEAGRVKESTHLGLLIAGTAAGLNWIEPERPADYFDLQRTVEELQSGWGVMAAEILQNEVVGAEERKTYGIKVPVFYAEMELSGKLGETPAPARFAGLPQFPVVRRDLALVLGREITHAAVEKVIQSTQIAALEKVELFDVFLDPKGEKIPAEKKSLAYALTYRAADRTLTEKEVGGWQDLVRAALQRELSCSFRDH